MSAPRSATPRGWLRPDGVLPPGVRGVMTTREGGTSAGPWGLAGGDAGGMNLGAHCGDDAAAVARNRALLRARLPAEPRWLTQVHGVVVHDADSEAGTPADGAFPQADASVATRPGTVCAVLVADCMPVLLAAADASAVGAAHAGWRGLADGVVEATVAAIRARAGTGELVAWLGASIGPRAFEVGPEVRERFCDHDPGAASAFRPGAPGKWLADLPELGRRRLASVGVDRVAASGACTVSDPARFYSFRRDRVTGRMAACVWIDRPPG